MSEKTSAWTFQEGHKRETRKSYQAYIEEISGAPSKEAPPNTGKINLILFFRKIMYMLSYSYIESFLFYSFLQD